MNVLEVIKAITAALVSVAIGDFHVLEKLLIRRRVSISYKKQNIGVFSFVAFKSRTDWVLTSFLDIDFFLAANPEDNVAEVFLGLDFVIDSLALVGNFNSGSLHERNSMIRNPETGPRHDAL